MNHAYATIRSYEEAAKYLGNKSDRPVANNTRIMVDDMGIISIRLHATNVVRYYPANIQNANAVVLYSGGYRTPTTKSRINEFCPEGFYVWQERGNWYLGSYLRGVRYPFAEGITIADGTVYNAGTESDIEANRKRTKQIKKYVAGYVAALIAGKVEAPSGGDCWYCHLVTVDDKTPLGEKTHNTEHLESHFEESYYVPSLLVNAINRHPVGELIKGLVGDIWRGKDNGSYYNELVARNVTSSMTRYLKDQFAIAN